MSNATDASNTAGPRRFKLLPAADLTAEQPKLYDAIRSGPRAKIVNFGAASTRQIWRQGKRSCAAVQSYH